MADDVARQPGTVPTEVDEADWLASHQAADGALEHPGPPEALGDRLAGADAADLLESVDDRPVVELTGGLPPDASEADVLEQHRLPTGAGSGSDDGLDGGGPLPPDDGERWVEP